jgi:hypothetical protein
MVSSEPSRTKIANGVPWAWLPRRAGTNTVRRTGSEADRGTRGSASKERWAPLAQHLQDVLRASGLVEQSCGVQSMRCWESPCEQRPQLQDRRIDKQWARATKGALGLKRSSSDRPLGHSQTETRHRQGGRRWGLCVPVALIPASQRSSTPQSCRVQATERLKQLGCHFGIKKRRCSVSWASLS